MGLRVKQWLFIASDNISSVSITYHVFKESKYAEVGALSPECELSPLFPVAPQIRKCSFVYPGVGHLRGTIIQLR